MRANHTATGNKVHRRRLTLAVSGRGERMRASGPLDREVMGHYCMSRMNAASLDDLISLQQE
jgi:hypothetical protein